MNDQVRTCAGTMPPHDWDRRGLPGWTYYSDELFDLEMSGIFRTHWQCVCHVNDIAGPGDFQTFDIAGERALIIRDGAGTLRAFHNLCRHRGSRIAAGVRGNCGHSLVCPYHGWTYNLDGTLRGPARRETFPPLDNAEWGLKPVETEIWNGFVFVRFAPGPQGSVADTLACVAGEVAPYGLPDLRPVEGSAYAEQLEANWKAVRDVDNEGYHVRQAHPGLDDLYGRRYYDEPYVEGIARSVGPFNRGPARRWSVRNYRELLPEATWLPETHRRLWLYVGMFPNQVFGFYPDSVIMYQEVPLSADLTVQRGAIWRRPDESRQLRVARYLSGRIDRDAVEEDRMLAMWTCEAARSSAYEGVFLSDLEYGLRTFHDHLRLILPVMREETEPAPGTLLSANERLLSEVGP